MKVIKYGAPLAVGLGGVGIAWLWFNVWKPLAVIPVAVFVLLGYLLDYEAGQALKADDPRKGARLIWGWIFAPLSIGVLVAGLLIVAAVGLEPAKKATIETQKLLSASLAAISAFGVAAFVKDAEEADESWIGKRFKTRFQSAYSDRFDSESPAERAVLSGADQGFDGWGHEAREARAGVVADALDS